MSQRESLQTKDEKSLLPKPLPRKRTVVRFVESHCHICQHTVTSRIDLVPNHCLGCGRTDWLKESDCCSMCNYYNEMSWINKVEANYEEQNY